MYCMHAKHAKTLEIAAFLLNIFLGKNRFGTFFTIFWMLIPPNFLTFPKLAEKFAVFWSLQGTAGSAAWLKPQEHGPAGLDKLDVNF